jgi:phenylalanine-4-hydroxylase
VESWEHLALKRFQMSPFSRPSTQPSEIPVHLLPHIVQQDASLYTPIDHASWRFILRISKAFFAKHAHQKYLDGLEETGISSERIPLIEEMDQKLRRFGWRAVGVNGFIPPSVFLEFQSLGILPIACEMRTLDHLAYTPAPDIVHEAAGHAPIIADEEFRAYLRAYGEVSRRAIFSSGDLAVYEAIRELSDLKEDPATTPKQIEKAQAELNAAVAANTYVSEATQLARMGWWSTEYGLIGDSKNPKIYGAGLLSSVGESYACLKEEVQKIPFTLDCLNTSYDITRPQPQLFVAPNFPALTRVLDDFASTMAFRRGGIDGMAKAKMGATVTTAELDSGLQIGGILEDFHTDGDGQVDFAKWRGPVQLAYRDQQLEGQGPTYHKEGYSTPLGTANGKSLAQWSDLDFERAGFKTGEMGLLRFDRSGIELRGMWTGRVLREGRSVVLTFQQCTITRGEQVLYRPEWGPFDLACGVQVISVYGGAGDRTAWSKEVAQTLPKPVKPKSNLTDENRELSKLYQMLRDYRENTASTLEQVMALVVRLDQLYPEDWLLRLEILELCASRGWQAPALVKIRAQLQVISKTRKDRAEMIARGLELLS